MTDDDRIRIYEWAKRDRVSIGRMVLIAFLCLLACAVVGSIITCILL